MLAVEIFRKLVENGAVVTAGMPPGAGLAARQVPPARVVAVDGAALGAGAGVADGVSLALKLAAMSFAETGAGDFTSATLRHIADMELDVSVVMRDNGEADVDGGSLTKGGDHFPVVVVFATLEMGISVEEVAAHTGAPGEPRVGWVERGPLPRSHGSNLGLETGAWAWGLIAGREMHPEIGDDFPRFVDRIEDVRRLQGREGTTLVGEVHAGMGGDGRSLVQEVKQKSEENNEGGMTHDGCDELSHLVDCEMEEVGE